MATLPKIIELNYIPLDLLEPDKISQKGMAIDAEPATNQSKSPINIDWKNLTGINIPDDEATRSKNTRGTTFPTDNYKAGDFFTKSDDNEHTYIADDNLNWVSIRDGTIVAGATVGATLGVNVSGGGTDDNQISNAGVVTNVKAQHVIAPSDFTAGENLTAGDALYFKASDGKVWKTDADADESTYNFIGFARATYSSGAIDVQVITGGIIIKSAWGLTAGTWYFLSGTAGAVNATPGTRTLEVGIAISTTELLIIQRKPRRFSGNVSLVGTATSVITCGFRATMVLIFMNSVSNSAWSNGVGDSINNQCNFENSADGVGNSTTKAWSQQDHTGVVDNFTATTFRLNQTKAAGGDFTQTILYIALG